MTPGSDVNNSFVFQIAEVNKALASVSYMVDNGYRVTFDRDAATGRDISMMLHKASGAAIKLTRDKNVWVLDAIVSDEESDLGRQR